MIFVSTIGVSGIPDLVVWSKITFDIALWVKSKMAAICPRSNTKLFNTIEADSCVWCLL